MGDNQSLSRGELIVLIVAIGLIAAFFITSAPYWLIGAVPVAITAIALIWHNLVLRQYRRAGTTVLAHSPLALLGATILMLVIATLITRFAGEGTESRVIIFLTLFLGGLIYAGFLPSTVLFYVADAQGLSSHVLSWRKMLPWDAIDWIYPQENRVKGQAQISLFEVPVFRWTEKTINVEAGPKRRMTLMTGSPLVGGNPVPLIEAIRSHATNALLGFDQLPSVNARRIPSSFDGNRREYTDLPSAIDFARQRVLCRGCVIFPARLSKVWLNLVSMVGLGIFLLGTGIYTVVANYSIVVQIIAKIVPESLIPAAVLPFFPRIDLVVFEIAGLVLLYVGFSWIRALSDSRSYFLLVTPDGFAAVKGNRVKGALFADTRNIKVVNGGLYGPQIKTTLRSGKHVTIEVNIFGRARDLLAYLLAGNKSEAAQHSDPLGAVYHTEQDVGS